METTQNNTQSEASWQGLTIEELRLKRAVALIKLEMHKERIVESFNAMVGTTDKGDYNPKGLARFLPKNIISKFSYIDYAVMGVQLYKVFSRVRQLVKK
ncbi:MAG: hypothetical protein HUK12_05470 [Muribaculaceae bacterium]|nr:hypothetical protein [Muribaculaceae bacterium]